MLFKESLTTFKNKTKGNAFGAAYDSNYGLYAAFSMYIIIRRLEIIRLDTPCPVL